MILIQFDGEQQSKKNKRIWGVNINKNIDSLGDS